MKSKLHVAIAVFAVFSLVACGADAPSPGKPAPKAQPVAKEREGHGGEEHGGEEHGQEEPRAVELSDDEARAAGVRTEAIERQAVGGEISLTGVIRPNADRLTQVAGRVPGRVVRVLASLGDRVKAGQPLAVLDSLAVGEARSARAQALAELDVAQAALERAESLRAENIVPEREYLRARGDFQKARAALAAANEKLRMLGVGVSAQGEGGSVFTVEAPFAGTVIEKSAVPGALSDPAKPLFMVADLSTVWIEANVFERDLARISLGAPASVTVSAWPGEAFKGKVTYVSNVMDPETRTVRARVEAANRDGRLRPGMFANVVISVPSESTGKALYVPEEAVVLMDGKPSVFVRGEHGFEAREVTTGARSGGRVELKGGVSAGEQAVIAGAYELKARIQKSQLGEGHAH